MSVQDSRSHLRPLAIIAADSDSPDYIPEQRLLAAVLERAILDLRSEVPIEQHIQRQCLAWIHSRSTHQWSFEWVCLHLDFNPKYIRKLAQQVYFNDREVSRLNSNRRGGNKAKPGTKFKPASHIRLT